MKLLVDKCLRCFIPGVPVPQGSKSMSRSGHMYEANRKLGPWRDKMTAVLKAEHRSHPNLRGKPWDEPVMVDVTFYLPRPKKPRFNVPAVKPDVDKLCRGLGDALEASGVLVNDSRITDWYARARYTSITQTEPGMDVVVEPLMERAGG